METTIDHRNGWSRDLRRDVQALSFIANVTTRTPQYTELKALDAKWRAYWSLDVHTHAPSTLSFIEEMGFTHVFFANGFYRNPFRAVCDTTYFLPIGFDDELHRPIHGVPKTMDIGLCGSPYRGRVGLVRRIQGAGLNAQLITGRYAEEYRKGPSMALRYASTMGLEGAEACCRAECGRLWAAELSC
jgi:hypothetical protein